MRSLGLLLILIFIIPLTSPQTPHIQHVEAQQPLFQTTLTLNIVLQFWGIPTSLSLQASQLPNQFTQTTEFPGYNGTFLFTENIIGNSFKFNYHINYITKNLDTKPLNEFISKERELRVGQDFYLNNSGQTPVNGVRVSVDKLPNFFAAYDQQNAYTINILDLSSDIFKNQTYWFYHYPSTESLGQSDMRNVFITGNKSIGYDINAFAPFYFQAKENSKPYNLVSSNSTIRNQFMKSKLEQIIQKTIIGMPYSRPYGLIDYTKVSDIYIANIIYSSTGSKENYFSMFADSGVLLLPKTIKSFLNFYPKKIDVQSAFMLPTYSSFLRSSLESKVIKNGSSPYLVIDSFTAENIKFAIRNSKSVYNNFPNGFFFLNLIYGSDPLTKFYYNSSTGLVPYKSDIVGLSIMNNARWSSTSSGLRAKGFLYTEVLHQLGRMFGLPEISNSFVGFIQSPMTNYVEGSLTGATKFTGLEKEILARRWAIPYNMSSKIYYQASSSNLANKKLFFIDRNELDQAEAGRLNATLDFARGNYLRASGEFIQNNINMLFAVSLVNLRLNVLYNSIYLSATIFFLSSLFILLKTFIVEKSKSKGLQSASWFLKDNIN